MEVEAKVKPPPVSAVLQILAVSGEGFALVNLQFPSCFKH